MSFVAKAVKKVFSGIKKIVKTKVFKWIAIAALVFFTAGVAAGGFAAFTGVNGIASFFTAVGQTMATGAASIASSLGFQGMSASLASHGGAAAIQAGLTTSATSATGSVLTANAATGAIDAAGGNALAINAQGQLAANAGRDALVLSAKGTAAAQAAANVSLAEEALGMSIAPGTDLYAQAASGTLQTGANLEGVYTQLLAQPPAGMSATNKMIAMSAISSGATAVLNHTAANNKRKPKTFVAGGLSRGGGTDAPGYTVSFDRSGGQSLASQRNVPPPANTDTRIATPPTEAQSPSVARNLSQGIGGEQPLFNQNRATYDADEAPSEYNIESILKAPPEAREGLQIAAAASAPEFQNNNSFFANFEAAPIGGGKKGSDFENRIFGGSILGVG